MLMIIDDTQRRRGKFNVGRVLVVSTPPTRFTGVVLSHVALIVVTNFAPSPVAFPAATE
jgi:hypothetical protein